MEEAPHFSRPRGACERGQGCAWHAPPPGRAEPLPSSAESPVAPAPRPSLGMGGPAVLSDGSSLLSGCAPRQRDPAGLLQRPERPLHLAAPLRRRQLLPGQRRPRRGEACGRARGSRGACPAEGQGLRRGQVRPPLGRTPGNGWGGRPRPDVPWLSPPARATGTAAGPRALRAAPQPPQAPRSVRTRALCRRPLGPRDSPARAQHRPPGQASIRPPVSRVCDTCSLVHTGGRRAGRGLQRQHGFHRWPRPPDGGRGVPGGLPVSVPGPCPPRVPDCCPSSLASLSEHARPMGARWGGRGMPGVLAGPGVSVPSLGGVVLQGLPRQSSSGLLRLLGGCS